MRKTILSVVACATLLSAGAVLAKPTAQQNCDKARVTAWKIYRSCVETKVANDAGGASFNEHIAFAKCRHTYFKKWLGFQPKASLATSTCIGTRFVGTPTINPTVVTDNLSGLQWEMKTTDASVHDQGQSYAWSASGTAADGGAFQTFLVGLNAPTCFAGECDWRLPTLAELQSIELDFTCTNTSCTCPSSPCIDSTFGATLTQSNSYLSATAYFPNPNGTWVVNFGGGDPGPDSKTNPTFVRAVRGGL